MDEESTHPIQCCQNTTAKGLDTGNGSCIMVPVMREEMIMKTTKLKFRPLDIVRTKFGTVAVVAEVNSHGQAYLAFAKDTSQKVAWYSYDEVTVLGNVMENLPIAKESV